MRTKGNFPGDENRGDFEVSQLDTQIGGKKEEDSSLEAGKGEKTRNVHRRACGNFNTALQRH